MGKAADGIISAGQRKPDRFTRKVWRRNLDAIGQIAVALGDEPEGCVSVVFRNHHREFWKISGDNDLVFAGEAGDYDWER